jgi:hypothetical protein
MSILFGKCPGINDQCLLGKIFVKFIKLYYLLLGIQKKTNTSSLHGLDKNEILKKKTLSRFLPAKRVFNGSCMELEASYIAFNKTKTKDFYECQIKMERNIDQST